jgi:hypothetical protein
MKFIPIEPPRKFDVSGAGVSLALYDCAHVHLDPDEQVTFTTPAGGEYDVTRKSWGFYATPSTNGRLASFGMRACLVCNQKGKLFVMLVERARLDDFLAYIEADQQIFLTWLDDDVSVRTLVSQLRKPEV